MKKQVYPYFSYGSNNLQQLAERVGRQTPFVHEPGVLTNHTRIFAGHSNRWGGGVASFYPRKGINMEGVIVQMTEEELSILDTYEGGYTRMRKRIYPSSKPDSYIYAYIYCKKNQIFSTMPSNAYLEAIHKNIKADTIPIYGVDSESHHVRLKAIWMKEKGVMIPT
ncbi:hypothetical protein [Dishui Lake large algae virus 1]|nr:hypothetical protein [Dishui Lake large algae virus 1]